MMFATPDFGASGVAYFLLLLVWVAVLALVAFGIFKGTKLLQSKALKARSFGVVLMLLSAMVPLCCFMLPPHVVYLNYGNYPLGSYPSNKIQEGMTRDEVESILGTPHKRYTTNDSESWNYWIDSFGITCFRVHFDQQGRVTFTHGN